MSASGPSGPLVSFFFRFASFFDFTFEFVHNMIHFFEFGMRLCNKYSTVNSFNKPSCD